MRANTVKTKTTVAQEPYSADSQKQSKMPNASTPNTKANKTLLRKNKVQTNITSSSAIMNFPKDLIQKCNTPITMNSMPHKRESE